MSTKWKHIKIPKKGQKIERDDVTKLLLVPDHPIIPFIQGDGIGIDITPVMRKVLDAAVAQVYPERSIEWMEVYAGELASKMYGPSEWLPEETLEAFREYKVGIKGPLTTPIGGGIRSLNVAIRQALDLYVCLRPVRYFKGAPSPLKHPEKTDMVIFRENSEGMYSGIEWPPNSPDATKVIHFLKKTMNVKQIHFSDYCGIGVKCVSKAGSERLIRKAIEYTIKHERDYLTLVHKGNIMKFTEGAFRDWGYALARDEFGAKPLDGGPWHELINPKNAKKIIIKDTIADAFLQQILLRPDQHDVIATLNLNGDYISDALAAQVGGIGISPGANLNDDIAVFEATHGTAPGYAGQDKVNPSSLILSAVMLLQHMGWKEAADLIVAGVGKAIVDKKVTYDFARTMKGATLLTCSEFGQAIIDNFPKSIKES